MEAWENYDLCLDSAAVGLDNCVEVIKKVIELEIWGQSAPREKATGEERLMEALAYYDGKIGTPEELMVPFNDRVHFFGDGVYDATVGANGKVYLMQDHLTAFTPAPRQWISTSRCRKRSLADC